MVSHTEPSDRVAAVVVGGALALAVLTVLTQGVVPPGPGPAAGGGAALPRVPAAGGTQGLVRALGVGSVTWYLGLLSAPLFLGVARVSTRFRWAVGATVAIHAGLARSQGKTCPGRRARASSRLDSGFQDDLLARGRICSR